MTLPVSAIVVTRNEAPRLRACLAALSAFDDIWVVDSSSADGTVALAQTLGAKTSDFIWNGTYPKKRQWCLDHLPLAYDWVFFVDADEIVPAALTGEIEALFLSGPPACNGYFVTGLYQVGTQVLRYGMVNRKLVLFDRRQFAFPVVDDLTIAGMGEIEGHYQPVGRAGCRARIGRLREPLFHVALEDEFLWQERHLGYAQWEAGMTLRGAWPVDPIWWRQWMKTLWRGRRLRAELYFLVAYILLSGWRDGALGRKLAVLKYKYYKSIYIIIKNQKQQGHTHDIITRADPSDRH